MTRNAWILSKETRRRRGWVGGRWGRQSMCLRLLVSTHQRRVRLGGLRGPLHEAPAGPLLSADGCMQYHPARKSGDAPPSLHCSEAPQCSGVHSRYRCESGCPLATIDLPQTHAAAWLGGGGLLWAGSIGSGGGGGGNSVSVC